MAKSEVGRRLNRVWVVALMAVVFSTALVVRNLSQVEWDPTLYTAFGEEAIPTRQYAEERLGNVYLRPFQGHDGKFFFVQANDPLVLDPATNASVLDRPLYRSQRMFYPVLAGVGGVLPPGGIAWSLIVVNVLAMGAGTWATSSLARAMSMSPWWGLSFALNLGFISEMNISGAGIVAAAAAFGALTAVLRGRNTLGVLLVLLAVLSREAMVIVAAGTAWWCWHFRRDKRTATLVATVPVAGAVIWALYLRIRIGMESGAGQVQEIGLPFVGFFQALGAWMDDPLDLTVGLAMMVLFAVFTRRVLISRHLVGWAFVGFVALGVVFTKQVWLSYFDITRAIAPLITAFVLLVFAPEDIAHRTGVRP